MGALKPDIGLRYLREGYSRDTAILFYDIAFSDIDLVSPGLYSVMFEYPYGDDVYALSSDFGAGIFEQLLAKLPARQGNTLYSK